MNVNQLNYIFGLYRIYVQRKCIQVAEQSVIASLLIVQNKILLPFSTSHKRIQIAFAPCLEWTGQLFRFSLFQLTTAAINCGNNWCCWLWWCAVLFCLCHLHFNAANCKFFQSCWPFAEYINNSQDERSEKIVWAWAWLGGSPFHLNSVVAQDSPG